MTVTVVNQWSGTAFQPVTFTSTPPAHQSVPVALTPASSVGGGSGTPSAGNWLVASCGWRNESPVLSDARAGVWDDIHSWWRPLPSSPGAWTFAVSGVPSSQSYFVATTAQAAAISAGDRFTDQLNPGVTFTVTAVGAPFAGFQNISFTPAAGAAVNAPDVVTQVGATRTYLSYTPNLARIPQYVYVAPTALVAGMSVLVFEVAGMGPWDSVTATSGSYASAVTSMNLALGAPGASALLIAAACGDNSAAGQALAPGGWTALSTVTASNGTDHSSDAVLTTAVITTSSAVSVNATATSAADMSGVIAGVLVTAPAPVPANANWPAMKAEAAFGAGYQTPPEQVTWTDITTRMWGWDETTGIQFQLGQVQASDLRLEIDNFDNALSTQNTSSPYYSTPAILNSDPEFESTVSPWTGFAGATVARSAAFAFRGESSMLMTPNGVTATPGAASELVTASAGSTYTLSAWAYCPAGWGSGIAATINWFNAAGSPLSPSFGSLVAIPAAAWTQFALQGATAPAGTAFAQLILQAGGTPSSSTLFYLDSAALVSGANPSQVTPLTSGTPIRIRAAIGTIAGVTANRWYVIARNIQEWPEQIDQMRRRTCALTGTDQWSVMAVTAPTPYRGENYDASPYAWWAMDDQLLPGGVQPTSLLNAATGNTVPMNVFAASGGVTAADSYSTSGTDVTSASGGTILPSVATYSVAQQSGWMYGDPQASQASYATSNPVTATPGSAAWQQQGLLGNTGVQSWFMAANDPNFPALASGITVRGWWNALFFGTANGAAVSTPPNPIAGQPATVLTLCTLATASAPVAVLQLDASGHLQLITYNGTTPASHAIYTSSDLRSSSWHCTDIQLTPTTWTVYVDGGLTAKVSGTATGMTSAWSWLVLNADLGTSGGSSLSSNRHGGNVAYAHWAVFREILQPWRILASYCSAVTGFGLLPAPQSVQLSKVNAEFSGQSYTPDGSAFQGSYGSAPALVTYTVSGLAVATAGSFTSGPSARSVLAGIGIDYSGTKVGDAIWISWAGLAPAFSVFTSASANTETNAAAVNGSGDSFTSGYGSGASGHGVCQTASGTGASPPASPSSLGDTVMQRIERIFGYGTITSSMRCIDPASLAVQAALQIGGQQVGSSIQVIAQSDGGMLFIDNMNCLVYFQKSHLAAQYSQPAWVLGQNTGSGQYPYGREISWMTDPHRVWNAISITPFSPDGATLPLVQPTSSAAVFASQHQYGAQPLQFTSHLQSQTEIQSQANWLLSNFGQARRRAENIRIDAATYPPAWPVILGANIGDVVQVQDWAIGAGGNTYTYRITEMSRRIRFGGTDGSVDGSVVLTADWEPPSYWS